VVTGLYVNPKAGTITFGAFYKDWSARQVWTPNTTRQMDQAVEDSKLEDVQLRALRHSHGEVWVKRQASRGLAPRTISTRMQHVRAVLAGAVRDKVISTDPFSNVTLPRQRKLSAAMRLPTSAEVAKMMAAAKPDFQVCIALAAFAGLRAGEVAGLQLGDIDFLGRRVNVQRQHTEHGARPTKCGSERIVHVPRDLVTLLSAQVARRKITEPTDWLFVGRHGEPMRQVLLTARWCHLRDGLELKHLRLHDLRHHYASGLIASGCDVVTVARALGHSDAAMTLRVYSHLWPSAEDRTRQAASGLMAAAFANPADQVRTGEGG
jgi:integrase